jgi:magnesium transporter
MSKKNKKRSKKTGMAPGSLVYVGDMIPDKIKITVTRYSETDFHEIEAKTIEECLPDTDGHITWIDVVGVNEPETIRRIGEKFNIHALTLEDIMDTDHRPKMDDHDEYLFIILKHFSCGNMCDMNNQDELDDLQVSFLLGSNYLISFQEADDNLFGPIRERLRAGVAKFWQMGAGYLAYSLMDIAVDNYFTILEKLDEAINVLEETAATSYDTETMRHIQTLRRRVISVRRAAWPLREVISRLERSETHLIAESSNIYFKDLYDHIIQIMDTSETFREILSNIFDIYLSSVNNKMNEIMKMLTIIATIMMPMTFVAGLYGMNFKYMPELSKHWGYPMALCIMISIAGGMLVFFRKKKWL